MDDKIKQDNVIKKIKFTALEQNNSFKVLAGTGAIGEGMNPHLSDRDALLMVQSGEIIFDIDGTKQRLEKSQHVSIPANSVHSFEVTEKCEVLLILDATAKIRFVK